jgi:hypothetical protein
MRPGLRVALRTGKDHQGKQTAALASHIFGAEGSQD